LADGIVIKREIVRITSRTGDVFSMDRAVEECPQSNTATTQTANALEFDEGTFVTMKLTAKQIDEAYQEMLVDDDTTNLVHKSGTETVTGAKTFSGNNTHT